jgi:GNAT superfamily N-acetyltransferase
MGKHTQGGGDEDKDCHDVLDEESDDSDDDAPQPSVKMFPDGQQPVHYKSTGYSRRFWLAGPRITYLYVAPEHRGKGLGTV